MGDYVPSNFLKAVLHKFTWSTLQYFAPYGLPTCILCSLFVFKLNRKSRFNRFFWNSSSKIFAKFTGKQQFRTLLFNPFGPSAAFHIEISHLICTTNQMAGLCVNGNTGLKWVNKVPGLQPTIFSKKGLHHSYFFITFGKSLSYSNKFHKFLA